MTTTPRTPLIAGNWKMNLDHLQAIANVQKLAWALEDAHHDHAGAEVIVCPPFTDLRSVQTLIGADKLSIGLGAQDVSQHDSGAFTGDISGQFLSKLEVKYVIVGHSERREHHRESNETVAQKAVAAIKHGLVPIVCVGENAQEREEHPNNEIPLTQLSAVLSALPENAEYVVAYEPVWAIGSGTAASPEEAQHTIHALRTSIQQNRSQHEGDATRILYGGSVSSANVAHFLRSPDIDGVLVGGASLDADEFAKIAQFQKHVIAQ